MLSDLIKDSQTILIKKGTKIITNLFKNKIRKNHDPSLDKDAKNLIKLSSRLYCRCESVQN